MRRRGLTIIELLFSLFILFTAVCALAAVMVSTYNYFHSVQDRTVGTQLALQQVRAWRFAGAGGDFSAYAANPPSPPNTPFKVSDDGWLGFPSFNPTFDGAMEGVEITVTMPGGTKMAFERGYHSFYQGSVGVRNDGLVAYGIYRFDADTVRFYNDAGGATCGDYPKMPVRAYDEPGHIPIYGEPGGVNFNETNNTLYVCDIGCGGTFACVDPTNNTSPWSTNPQDCDSRGTAFDATFANMWMCDSPWHCIVEEPAASLGGGSFSAPPIYPKPPLTELRCPTMVACDAATGDVWVTDEDMMCLRHYTGGTFETFEYKTALGGPQMGCPIAVAVVPAGDSASAGDVVVLDGGNIWDFSTHAGGVLAGTQTSLGALAGKLHAMGMARAPTWSTTPYVYLTDTQDNLYRFNLATHAFDPSTAPIH